MSYRIEYAWRAFGIAPAVSGLAEPRYVIAVEGGDNNCTDHNSNRRARDWSVQFMGTEQEVMAHAIYYAGACEGGSLQPRNRGCTAEAYVARIRRLVTGAKARLAKGDDGTRASRVVTDREGARGWWGVNLALPAAHPAVAALAAMGATVREEKPSYGGPVARIALPEDRTMALWSLVSTYVRPYDRDFAHRLWPWQLATVYGLPRS